MPNITQPRLEAKECWVDGQWDRELLDSLVASSVVDDIMREVLRRRLGNDILVWHPCVDGSFSTKIAWEVTRIKQSQVESLKWIWYNLIPQKMPVCMWKARFNCLPIKERVQSLGVLLASRCVCCSSEWVEDREHVLC